MRAQLPEPAPEPEKSTGGRLLVGIMITLYAALWGGAVVVLHAPGWRHVSIEAYLAVSHFALAVVLCLLLALFAWLNRRKRGKRA